MIKVMKRLDREVAMKMAFAQLMGGQISYDETVNMSYEDEEKIREIVEMKKAEDIEFAQMLVNGVNDKSIELDEIIDSYLKNWKSNNIAKVELVILRIALYEIKYVKDCTNAVVINEAVELAKKYCDDNKHQYINGVLGSISRDIEKGNL